MKNLLKLPFLAAGLLAAASPFVYAATNASPAAADASTTAPAAAPAHPFLAKHPGLRALLKRHQAIRQRVAKKLGLTDEQKNQLKAGRAKTAEAVKGIRVDASLTHDQKKAKIRSTVQTARTEARGVHTPEQQNQLKEMRARVQQFRGRQ